MRPPILWIAVGFATGLWAGLTALPLWWSAGVLVIGAVLCVRRAPVAGACAVAALAGALWGATARAERSRTCAGRWAADGSREQGAGSGASPLGEVTRAARVRLLDNVGGDGGVVDAVVRGGSCGGTLRVRWPEGRPAAGGTEWVVAGRWFGTAERGVLAARHVRLAEAIPRRRAARRGGGAVRRAVRQPGAARGRAGDRPPRRDGARGAGAVRAVGSHAPPLHFRAARRVHRRVARRAAAADAAARPDAGRRRRGGHRVLHLAARRSRPRRARGVDARDRRRRPPAPAGRRAPRVDRARGTAPAANRSLGAALDRRVALRRGHRRRHLG